MMNDSGLDPQSTVDGPRNKVISLYFDRYHSLYIPHSIDRQLGHEVQGWADLLLKSTAILKLDNIV
jgi:hypothetical protein